MQTLKIVSTNSKPFKGREGNLIPYYWVEAIDENGVSLQFGTKLGIYKAGDTVQVNLIKGFDRLGRVMFKEIPATVL